MEFIGIDLHLKTSYVCILNNDGEKVAEMCIPTTKESIKAYFEAMPAAQIGIEAGSHSLWVQRLLAGYGHEVVIANPRHVRLIGESSLKNDRLDAEILAKLVRLDPSFLKPISPRSEASQYLRGQLKARASLVQTRTKTINCIRGLLRAWGYRFSTGGAGKFAEVVISSQVPGELRNMVDPLIDVLLEVQKHIEKYDEILREIAADNQLACRLQEVPGVGPIIVLAYLACIDTPERFSQSREVGAYLGLRPRLRESGGKRQMGKISKEGDVQLRTLLIQGAHCLMRCRKDNALKTWATKLEKRVGKKKMLVALARKMAVLMHHLWTTNQAYQPFPNAA